MPIVSTSARIPVKRPDVGQVEGDRGSVAAGEERVRHLHVVPGRREAVPEDARRENPGCGRDEQRRNLGDQDHPAEEREREERASRASAGDTPTAAVGIVALTTRSTAASGTATQSMIPTRCTHATVPERCSVATAGTTSNERLAAQDSVFGELHGSASRSSRCSRARAIEMRSCASESRSRIVIVSSSSVWSSIVSAYGVPISSWRR